MIQAVKWFYDIDKRKSAFIPFFPWYILLFYDVYQWPQRFYARWYLVEIQYNSITFRYILCTNFGAIVIYVDTTEQKCFFIVSPAQFKISSCCILCFIHILEHVQIYNINVLLAGLCYYSRGAGSRDVKSFQRLRFIVSINNIHGENPSKSIILLLFERWFVRLL